MTSEFEISGKKKKLATCVQYSYCRTHKRMTVSHSGLHYKADPNGAKVLTDLLEKPLFRKAASLIPTEHLNALVAAPDAYQPVMMEEYGLTNYQIFLASNRWRDPICNTCWKKGEGVRLLRCTCCGLVHYCSTECQAVQWQRHREYVKHLPATPVPWKNDPNQVVVVKLPEQNIH